jgi:hypothetical protein
MADLPENSTWEPGIYQLAETDPVHGGAPNLSEGLGMSNVPAQQLGNRTAYLKGKVDELFGRTISAGSGLSGGGALDADRSLAVLFASEAEALAGSVANKSVSPLRMKQAITSAIDDLVAGAPAALDTLAELADALSDSDDEIAALVSAIATKLDASSYTAADVLAKLKTVDGVGSGLDADLLDGKQASDFLEKSGGTMAGHLYMGSRWIYFKSATGGAPDLRMNAADNRFDFYNQTLGGYADVKAAVVNATSINLEGSRENWDSVTLPKATKAQAEAGTSDAALMTPLRTKEAIQPDYDSGWRSGWSPYEDFTHGLGVVPMRYEFSARCILATGGLAVGDVLMLPPGYHGDGGNVRGTFCNATKIQATFDWLFRGPGGVSDIYVTSTNFDLRVRAWTS